MYNQDDDLYGDLYGDGGDAGATDTSKLTPQASAPKEEPAPSSKVASATPSTSFIPPAASSSSSFIPAAPADSKPAAKQEAHSHGQYSGQGESRTSAGPPAHISASGAGSSSEGTGSGAQGSGYGAGGNGSARPSDSREDGKMFVGGLNWDTTDEGLKKYFSQFGKVAACTIMRDPTSGKSRGFAFLTFEDPKAVNTVMVREHFLDGKIIDPKRAIPRPDQAKTQKCFVGGVPQTATQESFRQFFSKFGTVLNSTVMMDKDTGRPRGFGFVTFEDDTSVDHCIRNSPLVYEGSQIEVKRATSKNDPNERQPGGAVGGRSGARGGYGNYPTPSWSGSTGGSASAWGSSDTSGGAAGMGSMNPMMMGVMNPMMMGMGGMSGTAAGGAGAGGAPAFDPQAMARMYQTMGWGTNKWNPQMAWQQMMSAMGSMYGAGGAGMGAGGAWAAYGQQGGSGGQSADGAWSAQGGDGRDGRSGSPEYGRGGGSDRNRERSPSRGGSGGDRWGGRVERY
ncbi:RNA-binding domain-containing protein [Tilletiaria anomala UBC 951]|uniref:RNA-binding domain-containing protein n=1 Tax=Tilletiaria anomala (strain ATCC 24038 / CBS 436.72 / UBC 951) TaxID=1037660 RepID=A0A066VXJ4_TILAU|nr:RNA-binding domain-containing protein [Tilletiaria anomala UBC 951]KDN43539.1 RNA-binding domain-containing protein [Tilletiaria anomala UBC 951]